MDYVYSVPIAAFPLRYIACRTIIEASNSDMWVGYTHFSRLCSCIILKLGHVPGLCCPIMWVGAISTVCAIPRAHFPYTTRTVILRRFSRRYQPLPSTIACLTRTITIYIPSHTANKYGHWLFFFPLIETLPISTHIQIAICAPVFFPLAYFPLNISTVWPHSADALHYLWSGWFPMDSFVLFGLNQWYCDVTLLNFDLFMIRSRFSMEVLILFIHSLRQCWSWAMWTQVRSFLSGWPNNDDQLM